MDNIASWIDEFCQQKDECDLKNSWRVQSVKATLRRSNPRDFGIARISFVGAFDSVGVKVAQAVRPLVSKHQITTTQGSGVSAMEALCSAVMEAAERDAATGRWIDEVVCPVGELKGNVANLNGLHMQVASHEVISWTKCRDIICGGDAWLPSSLVLFPITTGNILSVPNTSGIAAGSTVLEATFYATLEVVERYYISLYQKGYLKPKEVLGVFDKTTTTMLESLLEKGYRYKLLLIEPAPFPVVMGFLSDTSGLTSGGVYHTSAAHPCIYAAINSVVKGFSQIIATALQGSREDLRRTATIVHSSRETNDKEWERIAEYVEGTSEINAIEGISFARKNMKEVATITVRRVLDYFDTRLYWKNLSSENGPHVVRTIFTDLVDGVVDPLRFQKAIRVYTDG